MKNIKYIFLLLLVASCSKDEVQPEADIFYKINITDKTVTFTNETVGAVSYRWEFGDGATSTDQSPVHTYPDKGKYVPTLYATTKDGRVSEGSTVIYIAKTSPVKLNDNSLADWDAITDYQLLPGAGETFFRKVKFDYDAQYVYVYIEVNSTKAKEDIYDFYLDTDNSATTGLLTDITEGGYDALLEGNILGDWLDAFNHKGAQNAFSFEPTGVTEHFTVGTVVESGGVLKFEMRIVRSKIKNLSAATAFRVGIIATKSDWSGTVGRLPAAGQPALLINFE
ncbi:PKD domain-containing protein [Chitinophaga sp. SYP-B3965]|uniref:PKD domain-containing protein n=1 Tax=Chitinophaga sp. SYP-B3965 TaxID=2663120 RepID=UPI001299E398|nr:PKD domain-containing protein [Chitinophaga sp. SYP-B3965]MRG48918.1 PKD domain-containing protein [Chitinophaga sp. SYP-B3965]